MIRYVPQQYPDLASALHACVDGDEVVLDTSGAVPLPGILCTKEGITIRAAPGRRPVLDHTDARWASPQDGLRLATADNWTFRALTFRDRMGISAAVSASGAGLVFEDCAFEGSKTCLRGNWSGIVRRCDFRQIQTLASSSSGAVRFESCRFLLCDVNGLLNLTGDDSSVEHCTFSRCVAGSSFLNLVSAAVVRANTALLCRVQPSTGMAIFEGRDICTFNNAWESEADTLFGGAGVVADNIEVDPRHVHPVLDLRLRSDSPLIGAAPATDTELDRNGESFLSPPSIGAHESARLGEVIVESLTSLLVSTTGGVPNEAACLNRESWRLSTAAGIRSAVAEVAVVEPGVFRLTLHPGLSAGQAYSLRLSPRGYGADDEAFQPPAELVPSYRLRPYRNIAAVLNAMGAQFFALVGRPEATIVRDVLPQDETIFVDSTRRFPSSGELVTREYWIAYQAKTDGAFHGVSFRHPRLVAVPAGTRVVLDERSVVVGCR
ncbi:MAG TPA: right-handed parallel beta-helix repeat-containing protein [Myxococcota bacterium]|nr:right-handed parallel beta-helix repeat-containing protein [Myxococcota bacterium]